MTLLERGRVSALAALLAIITCGSSANAQSATTDKVKDTAMIACWYASMTMESVAEQLAFRKDAVASVEGRKLFLKEVETSFGSLIVPNADLQTVILSSFEAGLRSYESTQKVLASAAKGGASVSNAERRGWIEAAREVERICLFRLGEISGEGRLGDVVRRR